MQASAGSRHKASNEIEPWRFQTYGTLNFGSRVHFAARTKVIPPLVASDGSFNNLNTASRQNTKPRQTMLVPAALVTLLGCMTSLASATALTFKLPANEKECFYTHVSTAGTKLAFYFAVQSGGEFDSGSRYSGRDAPVLTKTCSRLHGVRPWQADWQGGYAVQRRERATGRFRLHGE